MEKFTELSKKYDKYKEVKPEFDPIKAYNENTYQDLIANDIKKKQAEELYNILQEHTIMKHFIIRYGLWEKFLNDDEFLKYLREDYTGE